MSKYKYMILISVPAELEDKFLEVYDEDHLPKMLTVKGVSGCRRYKLERADSGSLPGYIAVYDIDSPEVAGGDDWKDKGSQGAWPTEIRPKLTMRELGVYRDIDA